LDYSPSLYSTPPPFLNSQIGHKRESGESGVGQMKRERGKRRKKKKKKEKQQAAAEDLA